MNEKTRDRVVLAARILMAILFLLSGISKVKGFEQTVAYIACLPLPTVGAVAAAVVELGGAMALIVGLHTRIVALVMAIFTVGAALFFHNFWALPASEHFYHWRVADVRGFRRSGHQPGCQSWPSVTGQFELKC